MSAAAIKNWPADKIERWPISKLIPDARNARTHNKAQLEQLRASFRRFGWTMPCLVREDGRLIAGHGRVEAAHLEGLTEVPVIVARGWNEEQCRAYSLADNRIPLNAGWDDKLLKLEIAALPAFDLASLGFDLPEIGRLLDFPDKKQDVEPQLNGLSYSIVVRCKARSASKKAGLHFPRRSILRLHEARQSL
jgi:ParB-like chromosome segregation protein Spo0J